MGVVVKSSFAEVVHWSRGQELLAHLDSCQTNSQYMKLIIALGCSDMREETNSFGSFYRRQGKYDESKKLFQALWNEDKNSLDIEDSNLLHTMNNLASTYWNQGRWKEAEELNVQVRETRKRVLG